MARSEKDRFSNLRMGDKYCLTNGCKGKPVKGWAYCSGCIAANKINAVLQPNMAVSRR